MLKAFSTELTNKEQELLSKFEQFYRTLKDGRYVAVTEAHQRFIDVCQGRATAKTPHEIVWLKTKMIAHSESVIKERKLKSSNHPVDEEIENAIKDEIKLKKDFARANESRAYISATF